jgi:hypothetical protein
MLLIMLSILVNIVEHLEFELNNNFSPKNVHQGERRKASFLNLKLFEGTKTFTNFNERKKIG